MTRFALSTKIDDSDWDALFYIYYKAFEDAPEIMALYPGGLDPAHRAQNAATFKFVANHDPGQHYLTKITETESNTIISYIAGTIYHGTLGNIDGDFAATPPPVQLPFISDPKDREWWEWYWTTGMMIMRDKGTTCSSYLRPASLYES